MHPVSVLTFGIFLAGYITARWDLVTRLYELAIFAWDHGVIVCTTLLTELIRSLIHQDSCCQRIRDPVHLLPHCLHSH